MTDKTTELVFILDKSGSMEGLENDTIGGFNAMLKKQKEVEGDCRITTVFFDNNISLIHDRLDINGVRPITRKEYRVGGCTALLDAIGFSIEKIVSVQKNCEEKYRADQVMFVIITDGMENASRRFTQKQIKKMIETEKKKYHWQFMFLGANIDAEEAANDFGIDRNMACDYVPDCYGTALNFSTVSTMACNYRATGSVNHELLNDIRKDMKARGKR